MKIKSIISIFQLSNLPILFKRALPFLCCYFMFMASAQAMIGRIHIDQFVWYHYTIIGAFVLGAIIPSTRTTTVSILIALVALYAIVEMLIAFDFVSDEWPISEDD